MNIKELMEKLKYAYDKNPNSEIGIWIWEDYGKSENFDSCAAEEADITGIFNEVFIISCDKKGSKKPRYGAKGPGTL